MKISLKSHVNSWRICLLIRSTIAISLQSTLVNAACVDEGIPAFANDLKMVELCTSLSCQTAVLSRMCGNIHYSSEDYETDVDQWLFRVRFHDEGIEDDEYSVILNGTTLPESTLRQVTCNSERGEDICEFIDGILKQTFSE